MENLTDTRVIKMSKIVDDYLMSLNSIKETFVSNYNLLKRSESAARKSLKSFINSRNIDIDDIDSILPIHTRDLKLIIKKIKRAELSAIIFPQSMLVSMVSQYDYFIGQLIQFIYAINPNLLNESNSQISYKDLFSFSDISEIKSKIIQDKIEATLRKSHEEQLNDLQSLSSVGNLKGVSFWKDFIEITQRRNLLVHCKGCVSEQYIKECKKVGITSLPSKGDSLNVNETYFDKAYFVFYTMGVLLAQVIIRHLLKKGNVIGEIDTMLTHIIYETLEDERYDISIALSEFALTKTTKHSCRLDEVYFVLNYAQAYKWLGNQDKCNEILSAFDFSAMTSDILVAKYALENDVASVVEHMIKAGNNSRIMTKNAYTSWVIFKEMRETEEFKKAYQTVFNEELIIELLTAEENKVVKESETEIQD